MPGWRDVGRRLDSRLGRGADRLGRVVSRRAALRTAVLTGTAAVGAVALGQRPSFASVTCPEKCGPSPMCPRGSCPRLGCPHHHSLCKVSRGYSPCPNLCVWSSGTWVHCTGYGRCGQGFKLCQDCKPHNSCNICECMSEVICRECCTPHDVVYERKRVEGILSVA